MIHTSLTGLVCCVDTYETQALETRLSLIAVPVGSAMFSGGEPSSMTILSALPRNPTLQPTHVSRTSVLSASGLCFCYRPNNVPLIAAGKQEIVRGSKLGGEKAITQATRTKFVFGY